MVHTQWYVPVTYNFHVVTNFYIDVKKKSPHKSTGCKYCFVFIQFFSPEHRHKELPLPQNCGPYPDHKDIQYYHWGNRNTHTDPGILWRKCRLLGRKSVPVVRRFNRLLFRRCREMWKGSHHTLQSEAQETQLQVLRFQ